MAQKRGVGCHTLEQWRRLRLVVARLHPHVELVKDAHRVAGFRRLPDGLERVRLHGQDPDHRLARVVGLADGVIAVQALPHEDVGFGAKHLFDSKDRGLCRAVPMREHGRWHKADCQSCELGVLDAVDLEQPGMRLAGACTEELRVAGLERSPALAVAEEGAGGHDGHDGFAASGAASSARMQYR